MTQPGLPTKQVPSTKNQLGGDQSHFLEYIIYKCCKIKSLAYYSKTVTRAMGDGGKIAKKHIHLQNMQFLFTCICLAQYEELHLPAYQIVAVCWVSTETQLLCPADTWVPGCLQSSSRPGLSRQISHHRRLCSTAPSTASTPVFGFSPIFLQFYV